MAYTILCKQSYNDAVKEAEKLCRAIEALQAVDKDIGIELDDDGEGCIEMLIDSLDTALQDRNEEMGRIEDEGWV